MPGWQIYISKYLFTILQRILGHTKRVSEKFFLILIVQIILWDRVDKPPKFTLFWRILMDRPPYLSDLTDDEWTLIAPLIPPAKHGGRPRGVDMREILNGLFYLNRTGCSWHHLPHDLPPKRPRGRVPAISAECPWCKFLLVDVIAHFVVNCAMQTAHFG